MKYGIMGMRTTHPISYYFGPAENKAIAPIIPMLETTRPSVDKRHENPSKSRWNPYFVSEKFTNFSLTPTADTST